jgi:O-antigen/teichoic acid export membrane protein
VETESRATPANYVRNLFSSYLNRVVFALVAFVVTPLMAHELGVVRFGVWALIGGLIPYFELLELGFGNATVTYVAKHHAADEPDLVRRSINTSFFLLMVPAAIGAGIVAILAVFLPHIVHSIPHDLLPQARGLLLLLALDMLVSIPMDTFGGALIAIQRYDLVNNSQTVATLLQSAGWIVVLVLKGNLVALGIVTVAIGLSGQVVRFFLARRLIPGLGVSIRSFDRTILRSFVGLSGWFSLSEISSVVVGGVDVIVVGIVAGVRAAGIFTVASRLASLPAQLIIPPYSLVFPYAAQLAGTDDRAGMRALTNRVTRQLMALVVPASLAVMFLASPAIRAWIGVSFHQSAEVAVILTGGALIAIFCLTPRAVVSGAGQPKIPTLISAAGAVTHIVLGIILCHLFGVVGGAETGLFTAILFEGIVLPPLLYRKLEMPLLASVLRLLRAQILPSIAGAAVGWSLARGPIRTFVDHHDRAEGIIAVVIGGLAVLAAYYAVYAFTSLTGADRQALVARVRARVRPRGNATEDPEAAPEG